MKRIIPIIAFIFLIHGAIFTKDDKGHPIWWWELQSADMVAMANISYDPTHYFTIESSGNKKPIGPQYYFDGKVTFKKIIYINKFSRFIDNYTYCLKNPSMETKILIAADRVYFDNFSNPNSKEPNNNAIVLRPSAKWGTSIDNPNMLIGLNQCYIFPIGHLLLDSVVPDEQKNEMISLIQKRQNNFIKNK